MLTFITLFTSLAAANAPAPTTPAESASPTLSLLKLAALVPEVERPFPAKRGYVVMTGIDRGILSIYLLSDDGGFICGGPAENCLNITEGQDLFMFPRINLCEVSGHDRIVEFYYEFMNTGKTRACQVHYCMPTAHNQTCGIEDMHPLHDSATPGAW